MPANQARWACGERSDPGWETWGMRWNLPGEFSILHPRRRRSSIVHSPRMGPPPFKERVPCQRSPTSKNRKFMAWQPPVDLDIVVFENSKDLVHDLSQRVYLALNTIINGVDMMGRNWRTWKNKAHNTDIPHKWDGIGCSVFIVVTHWTAKWNAINWSNWSYCILHVTMTRPLPKLCHPVLSAFGLEIPTPTWLPVPKKFVTLQNHRRCECVPFGRGLGRSQSLICDLIDLKASMMSHPTYGFFLPLM